MTRSNYIILPHYVRSLVFFNFFFFANKENLIVCNILYIRMYEAECGVVFLIIYCTIKGRFTLEIVTIRPKNRLHILYISNNSNIISITGRRCLDLTTTCAISAYQH